MDEHICTHSHTHDIAEKLAKVSPDENVLFEAAELLKTMARAGDCILFENDLPDNYSEV